MRADRSRRWPRRWRGSADKALLRAPARHPRGGVVEAVAAGVRFGPDASSLAERALSEIILHHYPQSPVSEKVRVGLGLKGLAWRSVKIPRLPPKPDLVPLTGGYRLTPVMQVGADVYCDSMCILREIERRHPEPTFFPGGGVGLPFGLARWTDGPLFKQCIAVVFGAEAQDLPPDFAADRGRLYFGPDFSLARLEGELEHALVQVRAQLAWFDERLTARDFVLGSAPGLPDALAYYLAWFLRGRYAGGPALLAEFPALEAWEARVRAIGHGEVSDMEAGDALEVALASAPEPARAAPDGLAAGSEVAVSTDVDDGTEPVVGRLERLDLEEIAIARVDPRVGEVVVHFPRVGYRIQ